MDTSANKDLFAFVSSLGGGDGLRVEERLGSGYVRLRVSEAERRQAKHDIRCVEDAVIELLRNSRDAGAQHIFLASSKEGDVRTLVILDDGCGIPVSMHDRVFDARVTSKLDTVHMDRWGIHGRGMALYSISQNALDAHIVASEQGRGTSLVVKFNTKAIPERADQHSWPTVDRKDGEYTLRGPRNILRTCAEFALESSESCKVYVGSPSEAVASMRTRMRPYQSNDIPFTCLPATCDDAKELSHVAHGLGLEMSERTAHRIIRKQIRPCLNVRTQLLGTHGRKDLSAGQSYNRTLSLSDEDKLEFSSLMENAFEYLAQKYYLRLVSSPRVRNGKGHLTVTFDYAEDDE